MSTLPVGPIYDALRLRFAPPKFALLFEVQNATGMQATRSADAIAMGLWPSVGLELHGIEIKASRADWLRELKQPDKATPIQKFCDRWWLVVPAMLIVRLEELPPTWGLLALSGSSLRCVREAPKLDAVPLTRRFLAALLRRSWEAERLDLCGAMCGACKEEIAIVRDGPLLAGRSCACTTEAAGAPKAS